MGDRAFQRVVSLIWCGGLLYIGHGLHDGRREATLPSFDSPAYAGGVALDLPRDRSGNLKLYTSDATGTCVYVWQVSPGQAVPKFVGTATATDRALGGGKK
jgi:hypothetical protein